MKDNKKAFSGRNITYAPDIERMKVYARKSSKNGYMLNSSSQEGPLEFMDLDVTREGQFYFIQNHDGEIIAAASISNNDKDNTLIDLEGISVSKEFSRQGLAKQLLWHVMHHTQDEGKDLNIDGVVDNQGRGFLQRSLPEILTNSFPDLRVYIDDKPVIKHGRNFELPTIITMEEANNGVNDPTHNISLSQAIWGFVKSALPS